MQNLLNRLSGVAALVASFGVVVSACGSSDSTDPAAPNAQDSGTDAAAGQAGNVGTDAGDAGSGGSSGSADAAESGDTIDASDSPDTANSDSSLTDSSSPIDSSSVDADSADSSDSADVAVNGMTIRLMAANLTSGNSQSYDDGPGQRIIKGVKPDVVMIQEFNYGNNSDSAIRSFVDNTLGSSYYVFRESKGQIPNGVISKYPIVQSGVWDDAEVNNRGFAWARIDIPGPVDLWAVSVHLLTTSSSERNKEAAQLIKYAQVIPPTDYFVIAGDFNTESRSEACIGTFSARLFTGAPHPADQKGNDNTSGARSKPHDWVLVSPSLNAFKTPLIIGSSTYANGLVFDSRVYSPLSEVPPVQSGDSGASSMQHMGVIKDFRIPQ